MNTSITPSISLNEEGLFYFEFERQFVEAGIRCIPMCVRSKLDTVGIKLHLESWCHFNQNEKFSLATFDCFTRDDITRFETYLTRLIWKYDKCDPLRLISTPHTEDHDFQVYDQVASRCKLDGVVLKWNDWMSLTELERFALSKLLKPGHESKNFVPALREFGLFSSGMSISNE